jgi:hypothetical protein
MAGRRLHAVFCSRSCRSRSYNKYIVKQCVICGVDFERKNNPKTCSAKCWRENYRANSRQRYAKNVNPEKTRSFRVRENVIQQITDRSENQGYRGNKEKLLAAAMRAMLSEQGVDVNQYLKTLESEYASSAIS